jgi:hypothetical protein
MRNIIIILLIILTASCSSSREKYSCKKNTIRILNKHKNPCTKSSGYCTFLFYLYDGEKSYWCYTDVITYESYNINDTLPTLVITKTIYETDN